MTPGAVRFLAAGCGAGYSPWAPGTAGTLAAVPLAWLWTHLPVAGHLALLLVAVPAAAWLCGVAARQSAQKDPGWIVLDEMVGFWVAVALVPPSLFAYGVAVVLFRVFDILKPPPAGWIDRRIGGGWGIVLDDVAAGLMARVVLELLL